MKKIYFAGGWFSPEQEERHTRIYELLLSQGYDIFNPKLESLITPESTQDHMTQTLYGNIKGILDADIVVALTDKPYDAGTIWETGFAYLKKPIVYYAENLNGKPFNLMLAKTGLFAGSEDALVEVLRQESSYELQVSYNFEGEIE
jgi:nucleoside 2-deoxyribosyltransferase